jgi:lactate dehydrogenase-like 2-hydroxyacid dehydrogenase
MKRHVLQLNPILVPAINDKLESLYHMHRLFEQEDKEAYIARHGAVIEGVITGGHTGISNALMDRLPALKVVAVNGVGTDAVDLNHARSKGLPVTGTFGALTEDVADLALGLMLAVCRQICPGHAFVQRGDWVRHPSPAAIPLSRRLSGKRVGIVGMGKVGRAIAQRAAAFGCPIAYTDLRAMDDLPHRFMPNCCNWRARAMCWCWPPPPTRRRASSMPPCSMRWARRRAHQHRARQAGGGRGPGRCPAARRHRRCRPGCVRG